MSSLLKSHRTRGAIAAFASSALAFGGAAALLGAESGSASSHREAPQILADPQVDNTDVYAFVSPDRPNRVTLIGNWIPFEEPAGGPNFYPFADDARYTFKIDNNGDAKADITYRWKFSSHYRSKNTFLYNTGPVTALRDPDLNFRQTYSLKKITRSGKVTTLLRHAPVAPSNVGQASMPNYAELSNRAIKAYEPGEKSFAGQADDSFFLDLRVFDLLYGADLSEVGNDTLSGYDVNTIALQVPIKELTRGGDPVIGVWSTTDRPSMRVQRANGSQRYSGKYVQVSRLGNPLINEVIIPVGLKDAFNALAPRQDATVTRAVNRVLFPEVPRRLHAIYGLPIPATPRDDLFKVFLTGIKGLNRPTGYVRPAELLRLNTSIPPADVPNRLGVLGSDNQGFPNGRRLVDDVVDIELQALEGAVRTGKLVQALAKGDGVNSNDKAFGKTFPYIALPHSG
ncbi:MAG: DUF4331 domain-containing protein, partial [Propionibacteriales bacterium]|nr:DUF4331 domain-containing protein [Propionibacteriales bacterium]